VSQSAPWMWEALNELGVREIVGSGDNPRIVAYHQETTLKATYDEVAWCSAFACWVMERAGIKSTRSAAARSWAAWGKPPETIQYGSIVVLSRGDSTTRGHVGFLIDRDEKGRLWLLGGNQGDAVSIATFPIHRVLVYRWPVLPEEVHP